jgi:PAS domain S-box-containing protein
MVSSIVSIAPLSSMFVLGRGRRPGHEVPYEPTAGYGAAMVTGLTENVLWRDAPDALLVVGTDGRILAANPRAELELGWSADELVGESVERLVPESVRHGHVALRQGFLREPKSRPMAAGRYLEVVRQDGTVFPAQISLNMLGDGTGAVLAAVRNATPWVETERRMGEAERRRTLAEERERIGRDLHDTVIQELFGVGMSLQAVLGAVSEPVVAERMSAAIDSIDDVVRQLRSAIFGLYQAEPVGGLRAAVVDVVASLGPMLGFSPTLQFVGPVDEAVPVEVAGHVLPTLREALTNVAKHALAASVEVRLCVGDQVELEVIDDGRGIPVLVERQGGLGNMARRAALLGGRFVVEPAQQGGTRVLWSIPLPEHPSHGASPAEVAP